MNYLLRLNSLGFLYTGTEDAPGNVGLWDQALALEWVNDNIRYFGGDPKQITIMGLSAGGWSVSLHVLSPITRNLFQNAILQSGAYANHMIDGEHKDHVKMWLKGSELIGCNDNKVSDQFTTEIIDCLKRADPRLLAEIPEKSELELVSQRFFPLVVIDGHFLPQNPTEMLESGDFKQDINLLFSTAADEGSLFLSIMENGKFQPREFIQKTFTYDQAYDYLANLASNLSTKYQINGEDVAKLYLSGLSRDSESDLLKRTIGIAVGDFILGCAPILFAKEVLRNSNYKSNVYHYFWNRKVVTNQTLAMGMEWWGPTHGGDDSNTKGLPFLDYQDYPNNERDISDQMIKFFTDFAKTGYFILKLNVF